MSECRGTCRTECRAEGPARGRSRAVRRPPRLAATPPEQEKMLDAVQGQALKWTQKGTKG
ncbi:MAG: hypothetical protein CW346_16975 [Bacillaceae bacterium]|nr:hypothetical protein [Bacillaceae bacterium]